MVYILLAGLGLALGSFINALVWRVHIQSEGSKKSKSKDYSIMHGRSMCPSCRHTLGGLDLIPLISWLTLGGRCRYCKKPISLQYPLVEAITAVLFVTSYIVWPHGFLAEGRLLFGAWLIILTGLIALAVYDLKWMLLPNRIVYPLMVLWALVLFARSLIFDTGLHLVVGAVIGLLVIGGLFWILFQLSGGTWIGGGDVKLGFLIGMMAGGALPAILIIFVASLLGTIYVLPLLISKKLAIKAQVPFGPFLILATILVFLFGGRLIESYAGFFLLV